MLTHGMLIRMKLFYEENILTGEAYTSDPSYPTIVIPRLLAGFEAYRATNALGSKLEKCKLIITDWSLKKEQDIEVDVDYFLCSLFEYGFEFYLWTGKLEKIASINDLISKRSRIEPVDSGTIKEAVTQLDVPLRPDQCVILDYFKIRELAFFARGKKPQDVFLDMSDISEYLGENAVSDAVGENAVSDAVVDGLIASFSGREKIIVEYKNIEEYDDYSGIFTAHLAASFPGGIIIKNIYANDTCDETLVLENERIQSGIESIKFGLLDTNSEHDETLNLCQLDCIEDLPNLKSIHFAYDSELTAEEISSLEPYIPLVHSLSLSRLDSLPQDSFFFPNLHSLDIKYLTIMPEEQLINFLINHSYIRQLTLERVSNLSANTFLTEIKLLPQLEKLEIDEESFALTGEQLLALFDQCPKLAHLNVRLQSLPSIQYKCNSLRSLEITGCDIGMERFFQFLAGFPSLNELILHNVSLNEEQRSEGLGFLNISNLKLTGISISAFTLNQLVLMMPQLRRFDFIQSVVNEDGVQFLFEGDCFAELEDFTLSAATISQELIEKLMGKMKRLITASLDFRNNTTIPPRYRISPSMIDAISSEHLLEVNLDFTRIGIDELYDLCIKNKQLQRMIGSGKTLLTWKSGRQYPINLPQYLEQSKHLRTNIMSLISTKGKEHFNAPKKLLLDANTELLSEAPRDVMEYITPKPVGDSRYTHPSFYRETPFWISKIENGTVTIEEFIPTDITLYTKYELIDNAEQYNEETYADQAPRIYFAEREYVLKDKIWQGLTSFSPEEVLGYLQADAPVEIGYSQQLKKYYVRLQEPSDEKVVTVMHIFKADPLAEIEKVFDPQIEKDIHSLLYSPNGLYLSSEDNILAIDRLMQLNPLKRAGALRAFYAGHPNDPDSGFKPGKLQGTFTNDIELINAIKKQKLGRCELQVTPLSMDAWLLGMKDYLIWKNAIHTILEVNLDGVTYTINPGGFPMKINLLKPSEHKSKQQEKPVSPKVPQQNRLIQLRQRLESSPDLSEGNPFITWKRGTQKPGEVTIDEYINNLILKTESLKDKRRNILVICEDSNQLELFNARLARYTSLEKQRKYYYLPSYDSYSHFSAKITENGYEKVPSQGREFITTCDKEDVFCINVSHIGTHYLWLIRLAEGHMGTYPLQPGLRLIMVIDKDSLSNIGAEMYRRLDLVEHMPLFPDGDLYNGCLRHYDAETSNSDSPICLYENSQATEHLKGETHIHGESLSLETGPLTKAIKSDASSIWIQNAPFHSREFRDFMVILCNTRELYHNGTTETLPQSFYIEHSDPSYTFDAQYSIIPLTEENTASWKYSLNRTTWSLFFKTYVCDSKTHHLYESSGWLAQNKSARNAMTILVTEDFPPNSWAEFLDKAKEYNVPLQFIVPSDITLPSTMSAIAQMAPDNKGKEKDSSRSSVRLILTNDVDFTFEHQIDHDEEDVVYHITEATKYSDLFDSLATEDDTLRFHTNYGPILQQLLAPEGKRAILKGKMSKEFAQHLETLFSEYSYLYINGQPQELKGQLIIITDEKKSFPYFNTELLHVNNEEIWEALNRIFPKEHQQRIQQLREACSNIHQKTKMDFTYIQLKTMMNHLIHHPDSNPFLPMLRLFKDADTAIQISKTHFPFRRGRFDYYIKSKDKRMAKLYEQLMYSYYVFIVGESGTAKTTLIRTQLLNFIREQMGLNVTLHEGIENLEKFIKEGGILYLDDADLKKNGAYDIFENMFNPTPGIGTFCPIDSNHRIIFSGKFSSYAHRKQHDFFSRHGNVSLFKDPRDDYLLEDVLKPVFANLAPDDPDVTLPIHQNLMNYLLSEYRRINALFPKPPLTPRNLQMMVLRTVVHARTPQNLFTLKPIMDLAINDELNGCTKQKDREGLPIWSAEAYEQMKAYEHYLNNNLNFQSSEYVLVPSRRNTLRLIYDAMAIRAIKTVNSYGISGFLQEGATTNGKSKIIIEALRNLGFVDGDQDTESQKDHYYFLVSADPIEVRRTFEKAFHEGAPLIIDELNTIPFIEELLNAYMSGSDLEGKPAQNPGFVVFATQNSISYARRNILSDAVHKRFTEDEVQDYTREEFIYIARAIGYEAGLVEQLVNQFLYAINLAEVENVAQRPTLHQLLQVLESYQPLKPRQPSQPSPEFFFGKPRKRKQSENDELLENEKGKEKINRKKPKTEDNTKGKESTDKPSAPPKEKEKLKDPDKLEHKFYP